MRLQLLIIFLLISSSTFAQNLLTIQDLVDIYDVQDKLKAIQIFELKGYTPGSDDDRREMFTSELKNKGVVYTRSADSSSVGFMFAGNKIDNLFFADSVADVKRLLPELEKVGFKLARQIGEVSKTYTKKKTSYFVIYEVYNDKALLIVMRKTKNTREIFDPKG